MILDAARLLSAKLSGYSILGDQKRWRESSRRMKIFFYITATTLLTLLLLLFFYHAEPQRLYGHRQRQTGPYVEYILGKHWHGWSNTERMLVFGDSWSTTCFKVDGPEPSIDEPIGFPGWPGETVGNGPNWAVYLTYKLNDSTILTADFATGGGPVVDLVNKDWRSLRSQVDNQFAQFNDNHTDFWRNHSSLFFIWIGINDIHYAFNTTDAYPAIMTMYAALVEKLYTTGARNFFIVNVPPLARSPYAQRAGVQDIWRGMVSDWNKATEHLAWDFAGRHSDVTLFFFDSWRLLTDIMDRPCTMPESCELVVMEDYCPMYSLGQLDWNTYKPECPHSVDKYFWIDPLHPTTVLQNATAHAMHRALLSAGKG